ncbi:MAG: TRAP transporter large permease [Hyphomicrobiaceae bacterium]
MELLIVFLAFFVLIFAGVSIAAAIGASAALGLLLLDVPMLSFVSRTFGGIDSTPLLTLPFFVLAGELMYRGGVIDDLVDFADAVVGWIRGGLAYVNILVSLMFSGPSGSTVSDTAAVGSVMIPSMVKRGFDRDFAVVVTVMASTMAPMIPPSTLMIVYAHIAEVSIGQMFMGGVIPGLIIAVAITAFVFISIRVRGYDFRRERPPVKEMAVRFVRSIVVLLLPLAVVLGIRFGIVTPTESAILCVLLVAASTLAIRRSIRLRQLPDILLSSAVSSGMVMIIIALSTPFGDILSRMNFQDTVQGLLFSVSTNAWVVFSLMIAFVVVLGTVVEATAICIMFAGTFSAIGAQLGFDPIHFGVVMIFAMIIASVTPPVAISLFVAIAIARTSMREVEGLIWKFMPALIIALAVTAMVPGVVLVLARLVK